MTFAGQYARLALALRLALVAVLMAVSSLPAAARPDGQGHAPCALVADHSGLADAVGKTAANVVCDHACPMHMALLPEFKPDFVHALPVAIPDRRGKALRGRAPPSPERPPRSQSA